MGIGFATNSGFPEATLAGVGRLVRLAILVAGIVYLWALLPVSFRPQYTGSPFRKPDATVTVNLGNVDLGAVPTSATVTVKTAAAVARDRPSTSRLKAACEPPTLLRPVVRPAESVVVHYLGNGKVVAETRYDCKKYV